MPSKNVKQAKLMAAAAHTKGGYGGVSQAVGKEFNTADAAKSAHMAKRQASGLKHREIADEFGTSRQTVGRKLKGHGNTLKQGYNRLGSAAEE